MVGGAIAQEQPSGTVMTHVVQVGDAQGTKKFYPEKIKANAGDMVQFHFYPMEHSVAQSSFDKPCEPIENSNSSAKGFWSGFMPVKAESKVMPVFTVVVNDTNPVWFYCATMRHCQGGMVGVINEPEGKTLDTYKQNADLVAETGIPAGGAGTGGSNSTGTPGSGSGSIPSNSSNPTAGTPPAPSPSGSGSGSGNEQSTTSASNAMFVSGATLSALVAVAMSFVIL